MLLYSYWYLCSFGSWTKFYKYTIRPFNLLTITAMKSFANSMAEPNRFLLVLLLTSFSTFAMAAYNVVDFGARPDGLTDSANGFLRAWAKACSSGRPAIIHVPQGRFFVSQATFLGPCKNPAIRILIKGTIVASTGYGTSLKWLYFKNVNNVAVYGGILDGRGQALWDCKKAGRSCPTGAIVGWLALGS